MSSELKYIRRDALENSFRCFDLSPNRKYGLALNPVPNGSGAICFALERTGNVYFIVDQATFPDFPIDAPLEVRMRDDVGEVFSKESTYGVKYDFSEKRGTIVHKNMWTNHPDAKSDSTINAFVSHTIAEIRKKFFSVRKGIFRFKTWKSFILKDADDDWTGVDHKHSKASLLLLTEKGEHIIHACLGGNTPLFVSSFKLPPAIIYPIKVKVGFSGNMGAVSINDEHLVGIFDFNALLGEVLEAHQWDCAKH